MRNFSKLIVERLKHLTGQHNQKLHGNRGAKVSNAVQAAGNEQYSSQISLAKTDKQWQKEAYASHDVAASMQKTLDKFDKYFGFKPQVVLSRGTAEFALRKARAPLGSSDRNWIVEVRKSKAGDNTYDITIDHNVLENYLNTAEQMNFSQHYLNENGINLQAGMKMTREKLRDHIIGAAVAQAYYQSVADVTPGASQTYRGSVGTQPKTYTSASFENNPKIVDWIKLYSYKKGVDSHMPGLADANNRAGITSTQRRNIALTGLYNAMSTFANGGYLPPDIRQFILTNFYQKPAKKERRYKHLQGKHNQRLHGNRGGVTVGHELIRGLDPLSQRMYSGLDTKDQVKFRLGWYRELKKNPNADPKAFMKAFNSGSAPTKSPTAPKAKPAAATPVAAGPKKAANLTDSASIMYIDNAKKMKPEMRTEVDAALSTISGIHKIPNNASQIYLRPSNAVNKNGEFLSTQHKDGSLTANGIMVSKYAAKNEVQAIVAHEYGHYLKDEIVRNFDSPGVQKALDGLTDAIRGTRAYQRLNTSLKTIKKQGGTVTTVSDSSGKNHAVHITTLDYLIAGHETFARAYAQYIAFKSGNKTMLDGVYQWGAGYNQVAQWSRSDFAKVEKAFDNLFTELGW